MTQPHAVHRLTLTDFRNYAALSLDLPDGLIVLTGANGAGKTNILEAVSLLVPGRGLRRAALDDLPREKGAGGWAVAGRIAASDGDLSLGTGVLAGQADQPRTVRIEGENVSVQSLGEVFSAIWLTPQMDGILSGPAGDRRRFFDRLVLAGDPLHGRRYAAFERAMRQRNKALEDHRADPVLLDALEAEMAAQAVSVSVARDVYFRALTADISAHADDANPFPWAELRLDGMLEDRLTGASATAVEDAYRDHLARNRLIDARAGRTLEGPHRSDLAVRHGPKDMEARRASTGEQKALLTGLLLAHTRLVTRHSDGRAPVLLFDEVAAHLDDLRRQALFDFLLEEGLQAMMTGTDAALFSALDGSASFFNVASGAVAAPV